MVFEGILRGLSNMDDLLPQPAADTAAVASAFAA
jgi:hypothetical protein